MKFRLSVFPCFFFLVGAAQMSIDWKSTIKGSDIYGRDLALTFETSITDSAGNIYVVLHQSSYTISDTVLLVKYDQSGIVQYIAFISDSINCHGCPYKMLFATDGDLLLAFRDSRGGKVVKIDPANGSLVWSKRIPLYANSGSYADVNLIDFKLGPDNNLWLLTNYYPAFQADIELWFVKMDQNGTGLKTFKSPVFYNYAVYRPGIHFDQADNMVFLKGEWDTLFPPRFFFSTMVKIDTIGNTVLDSLVLPQGLEVYGTYTVDNNGSYILSGGSYSHYSSNSDLRLKKIDPNFNAVWQKVENLGYSTYANIKCDTHNNIYAFGSRNYVENGQHDMFIIKYDQSGNKLWQYNHPDFNELSEYPSDFYIGADGNLYIFMLIESSSGVNYALSVVKLDAAGQFIGQFLDNSTFDNSDSRFHQNIYGDFVVGTTARDSNQRDYFSIFRMCLDSCKFNVSGTAYLDADNNCSQDSTEPGLTGRFLKITPGDIYLATGANGNFQYRLPDGVYTLEQTLPYHWTAPCASGGYQFTLSPTDTSELGISIGSYIDPNLRDLNVGISNAFSWFWPAQRHVINFGNKGGGSESGYVSVEFDTIFQVVNSTPPPDSTLQPNHYLYNYTDLHPGETRVIKVQTLIDTNVLINTNSLFYQDSNCVQIFPNTSDVVPDDNYDCDYFAAFNWLFFNALESYNTLAVHPGFFEADRILSENDTTLTYKIGFVNAYARPIKDLVIRDTLSEYLDFTSLQVIAASHEYNMQISGNGILQLNFKDINLTPADNHEGCSGFIKFKLRITKNIHAGATIENRAVLYYDYGVPNLTNKTINYYLLAPSSLDEINSSTESIIIYPNPGNGIIFLEEGEHDLNLKLVSIFDLTGKKIIEQKWVEGKKMALSVHELKSGIYFIRVSSGNETYTKKLVIVN